MEKCVTIVIARELSDKVLAIINGNEARALLGVCSPFHFVTAIATPDSKETSLARVVSEAAVCCADSSHYLIYIGNDISEKTEGQYGVLLPAGILDDKRAFREDVIYRIRKFVGSPIDN